VLFENAMRNLGDLLWDELSSGGERRATPGDVITARLLAQPYSPWWDRRETPAVERRDDILASALGGALDAALQQHGEPDSDEWLWSRRQQARIEHVLGLPALAAPRVPARGGPSTISPSSGSGRHGASWRMVVELGPEVRAWGVYPGGQSGNPASERYMNGVATWGAGELDSLRFPRTSEDLGAASARVTLRPRGAR
jgi:penicillin amidase